MRMEFVEHLIKRVFLKGVEVRAEQVAERGAPHPIWHGVFAGFGAPAEPVGAEAKDLAAKQLAKLAARKAAKKAAKPPAPAAVKPAPAPTTRPASGSLQVRPLDLSSIGPIHQVQKQSHDVEEGT